MLFIKSKTPKQVNAISRGWIFRAVLWISIPCQVVAQAPDSTLVEQPAPAVQSTILWGASDSTRVISETSQVQLFGSAFVAVDDIRLEADRITYDEITNQACAFSRKDSMGVWIGRPVLTQGGQTFEQDELCFDLETRRGLSRHSVTVQGEAVFHAEVAKRQSDERIHVSNAKFTTCDAENPHFHFHLKRAIMIPGEKVISGPFYLKFRKIPTPLALPFGWFPTPPEKRSHGLLMPGYGNGGSLGFFLKDLGYYLPLGEQADTRLMGDIYSGGSWAIRSQTNYNVRYRASGSVNLSFQQTRTGFTGLPSLSLSNQAFVRWSHNQDSRSRPNSRFSASVNFGSANNFTTNLSSTQQDYLSNTFQSSAQWSKSFPGKPINLALSARHSQNSLTHQVDVTLPSLTANLQRTSLAELLGLSNSAWQLLQEVAVTASSRFEQTLQAPDSIFAMGAWDQVSFQNGIKHSASASSQMRLGFVSITPNFQFNEYWGFEEIQGRLEEIEQGVVEQISDTLSGFNTTRDWRLSANASTRFYGTFQFGPDKRIPAIRHVLSPSLGMSYTPENSRTQIVELDDESWEYNPYGLNRFKPQNIRASKAFNFSLSQNLEAKVRDIETGELRKVRIIDNIVTSANYNMVADSLRLSDITTRANTDLFDKVRVNVGFTHSAYDRDSTGQRVNSFLIDAKKGMVRLTRANAALGTNFRGGQDTDLPWDMRLDYNLNVQKNWVTSLQQDTLALTQTARIRGGVRIFERWKIDVNGGYDFVNGEFTNTQLDLYWDLHCWELAVNVVPFGYRKSIYVRLNIKASMLKDLKMEFRENLSELNYW
ncbi:MAG: putative LPS assembly protein LptD [Flavobacteriales bacterium]|nr:putative LPS assembly protein LptD [Flavobacteriales bacterium]